MLTMFWLVFATADAAKPPVPQLRQPRGNAGPMGRASFFMERHRFRDAALAYREILEERPDSAKAHLGLGEALSSIGKCEEAIEELALARQDPTVWDGAGASAEGYCRNRAGDPMQAVAAFEEAVRIEPEAPIYSFRLALAQLGVGDVDAARDSLDAIPDKRRNASMRALLAAWIDYETGADAHAFHLHQFDELLARERAASVGLQRRLYEGVWFLDNGENQAANRAFYDAVEVSLQHLRAAALRAEAVRRMGHPDKGAQVLDRRVLLADNSQLARAIISRCKVDTGDLAGARETLAGLEDAYDEAVVASLWYLARAEGDEARAALLAEQWAGFPHPATRSLEQLVPIEAPLEEM